MINKLTQNIGSQNAMFIQCVYGDEHIDIIEDVLIPSIIESTDKNIIFSCTNYNCNSSKFIKSKLVENITIENYIFNKNKVRGFAEAHNDLFKLIKPTDYFLILNPDCIVSPNAFDLLVKRFLLNPKKTGIVEGRQWPAEHPKEFDPLTLRTPWASGAFCLINAEFYASIGGMDENYFLYNEDVDLSWMSWLNNLDVLYERNAVVTHFTNSSFFHDDNCINNERYYSTRNFIAIAKKFFGNEGERNALQYLKTCPDKAFVSCVVEDYENNMQDKIKVITKKIKSPYIKITGINQYHKLRI